MITTCHYHSLLTAAIFEIGVYDLYRRGEVPSWRYIPDRRTNFIEITLFQKQSLYKVHVDAARPKDSYRFTCVYGTKHLCKATTLEDAYNALIREKEKREASALKQFI